MIGVWSNYLSLTKLLHGTGSHRYQTELMEKWRNYEEVGNYTDCVWKLSIWECILWVVDVVTSTTWHSCQVLPVVEILFLPGSQSIKAPTPRGFQGSCVMKLAALSGCNEKRLMIRRLKINLTMDCNNNNNSLILILNFDVQCLQTSCMTSYCINPARCRKWAEAAQRTHEVLI